MNAFKRSEAATGQGNDLNIIYNQDKYTLFFDCSEFPVLYRHPLIFGGLRHV